MTCIVGIADREHGHVTLGSDSLHSAGSSITILNNKLCLLNNGRANIVIGSSGATRAAQLLEYAFTPPNHAKGVSIEKYLITDFADALHEVLLKRNVTYKKDGESAQACLWFIFGYGGILCKMHSDFSVDIAHSIATAGCGGDVALGALEALPKSMSVRQRLLAALKIAEKWNHEVRRPFHILSEAG